MQLGDLRARRGRLDAVFGIGGPERASWLEDGSAEMNPTAAVFRHASADTGTSRTSPTASSI